MQAERLRIAAEMNIRKEARTGRPSLRRTLVHVQVLESLDELVYSQPPSPPPSYTDTVEASQPPPTSCIDFAATAPNVDESPELESDDGSESDEWSSDDDEPAFDDEFDADHALVKVSSHPPIYVRQSGADQSTLARTKGAEIFDAGHLAELVSEMTVKPESDSLVTTDVVEVVDDDD